MKWLGRKSRVWLAHRRLSLFAGLAAMLLSLPSLWVGWVADDQWHRAVLHPDVKAADLGIVASGSTRELFSFFNGDPDRNRRLMDLGVLPWWAYERVQAAFWRPVAVLTHKLDYHFWPDRPLLMHAQSIVWLGGLAAAVAVLYRRIGRVLWIAGLAAILFAIDDAHGTPVGFLANRNALIAALFGVLAVLSHDTWRRKRSAAAGLLSTIAFAMSLLSAEAGIATLAYIVSYAVFMDHGRWRARLGSLAPTIATMVVWRVCWSALGYGVSGLGSYMDPLASPWDFCCAVLERAPILLLGQLALPPSELPLLLGAGGVRILWCCAAVFIGATAVAIMPILRRRPEARFWAGGMLLSLIPICATFTSDRNLVFVGIGAFALVAEVIGARPDADPNAGAGKFGRACLRILAGVFVFMHLAIAPVALLVRAGNPVGPNSMMDKLLVRLPDEEIITRQSIIIVNPPIVMLAGFTPVLQAVEGRPVPVCVRTLGASQSANTLTRRDANTLIARPTGGFLAHPLDGLFRGPDHPLAVGDRIELAGMTVTVTELNHAGRPAEVAFVFEHPLEDPSYRWLQWTNGAYAPFAPPPVGKTTTVKMFDDS